MDDKAKASGTASQVDLIQAVKTPLGFFVLVVLGIEAILGVVAGLSSGPDRTLALLGMLVVVLALVAIVAFMAYQRPEALSGVRPPASPVQAAVLYPPTEKSRYDRLFDDFADCDFYAFNPPFQVEYAGKRVLEDSLATHEKRYRANVSSHYLFFSEESYGNAERFFEALGGRLSQAQLDKYVERVYWEGAPSSPGYTFFIGKKRGKPAIVFYPNAVMENGIPRSVIYIEGAEELHSILQEFFLRQWNFARQSMRRTE